MKIKNALITFLILLISIISKASFADDKSILIEREFTKNKANIDGAFILYNNEYEHTKYLITIDEFLIFINSKNKTFSNPSCSIQKGTWNFKYRKYLNHRIIKIVQHKNYLYLLTPTTLSIINIDKCLNAIKRNSHYRGELLKKTEYVNFWGAAGFNGFFCDLIKSKTQLFLLKCDGNVTSYNLSNHEIVASGETIKPQLYMSWGDGGRTKGGEPHLRFGEIDGKIYIFGMYSISETVHNQKLILNQIEEFSLNVKKQIIFKCDDLPVRALHLIKDKKKINIYGTSFGEFHYTAYQLSDEKCLNLNKRKFWINSRPLRVENMRGLFSDNYFFDGSIKNTITEEIIKISILDNALKKKDKYCAPKGFYISKEDGSAILACANEIVLLEDYFKISFTKKIKNLIDKLF